MKLRDYKGCPTAIARPLDLQLIAKINQLAPNTLVDFSHLAVQCGSGVHPFMQASAMAALERAIAQRGIPMEMNSAYRTLAQQALLYQQYLSGRCGIRKASVPGSSNHERGLAIDIEDARGWRGYLELQGWKYIGDFDPMHYDFRGPSKDIRSLSILAFQYLWNENNPADLLATDGRWGPSTEKALFNSPLEGFSKAGESASDRVILVPTSNPTLSSFPRPLSVGSSGKDVLALQSALIKRGFALKADGDFGQATLAAVKAFQRSQGLSSDGIAGVATFGALKLK